MMRRIKIKGYKSIKESDLNLNRLNVLIGANGAGKSNFVSLFELLYQIIEDNLELFVPASGGADSFLHSGRKITPEICIRIYFDEIGWLCRFMPGADDKLVFSEETCFSFAKDSGISCEQKLGQGHKQTKLYEQAGDFTGKAARHIVSSVSNWGIYHFHDTGSSAKVKLTNRIDDNRKLHPDASNLAAYLYYLKEVHSGCYQNIVDAVRMAAPFFDTFSLSPYRLNPNHIKLEWKEKGCASYFDGAALSDGTLRFISLATLLLQPELPSIILIDEPELGLHPYAIKLLSAFLKSASEKSQVIVCTQSVTLVNQFAPSDIVIAGREEGETVFNRPDEEKLSSWLEDYSLGELWEKNVIGGRPVWGLSK
ncbi:MAG: AAA family ATPase [Desulfobacterales bacterium]|nr:AAA family ATPase [Desulfobacterales bacterium]